jgi:hypothetical protein
MIKLPKRLNFLNFFLTDVRQNDRYNFGNMSPKIQTYTFLYAKFVREVFEQVYFNHRNLENCQFDVLILMGPIRVLVVPRRTRRGNHNDQ